MLTIPSRLTVKELHSLLDDSLVVRHIAEPLAFCNANEDQRATKKMMVEKNFDMLGLKENGLIKGYVRRSDLSDGKCRHRLIPFQTSEIIASQTPIIQLLPLMKSRPTFFVLERTEINALVHLADLDKWPVRMLLFGLVSLLEMYTLRMVRVCYPGVSFENHLTPNRVEKAKKEFSNRRSHENEVDLADCLNLTDKTTLLRRVSGFNEFFKLPGERFGSQQHFKQMETLRNKLAHAQDMTKWMPWGQVIEVVGSVESFLKDCERLWDEFVAKFSPKKP